MTPVIGFDLLLAVVVGLVFYATSARYPQSPPDFFDGLQLLLVVSALVVKGRSARCPQLEFTGKAGASTVRPGDRGCAGA